MVLQRDLPQAKVGDLLVIHDTGAYGASMSSNYNTRPLIPEVLLEANGQARLIRRKQTVAELIAAARAKPGVLNYASAGVGSATHVNAEKFRANANLQVTHIPFKGTPETIVEVSSGRTDFMFTPVLASIPSIRDNRLRALAVSTAKRSSALPNVPTVAESGLPGFAFDFWIGMLAPSKTPKPVVAKINAEVARILALPEVKERMATLGAEPMPMSPDQFDAYIKEEYTTLGAVMRSAPK